MKTIRLLLEKDLRALGRGRLLATGLVVYPLLIALVVGVVVRYAGDRPEVSLVGEDALPSLVRVGDRTFDYSRRLADAEEVRLVSRSAEDADRELDSGRALATLVIPDDFAERLTAMRGSPKVLLVTTRSSLSDRVVEKVRALVYTLNLELQQAYITANLAAVDLLLRGGRGSIGRTQFTLLGLANAERRLTELAGSSDAAVATRARELLVFVRNLRGAVRQVGVFLRATANPVVLTSTTKGGRKVLLSAQLEVFALALALAFVATLLAAAALTAERDEGVAGRLLRLVPATRVVLAKTLFAALVATAIALVLALVSAVLGDVPWTRLPVLAVALAVAAIAFGAFGTLLGALGREPGTAMLLAFLVALPLSVLGVIPGAAGAVGDVFPFGHAADLFSGVLYDASPGGALARGAGWLAALAAVYAAVARLTVRRLVL
jgi:hypothetical protein